MSKVQLRCTDCGAENPEAQKYCVQCGRSLFGVGTSAPVEPASSFNILWTLVGLIVFVTIIYLVKYSVVAL